MTLVVEGDKGGAAAATERTNSPSAIDASSFSDSALAVTDGDDGACVAMESFCVGAFSDDDELEAGTLLILATAPSGCGVVDSLPVSSGFGDS